MSFIPIRMVNSFQSSSKSISCSKRWKKINKYHNNAQISPSVFHIYSKAMQLTSYVFKVSIKCLTCSGRLLGRQQNSYHQLIKYHSKMKNTVKVKKIFIAYQVSSVTTIYEECLVMYWHLQGVVSSYSQVKSSLAEGSRSPMDRLSWGRSD